MVGGTWWGRLWWSCRNEHNVCRPCAGSASRTEAGRCAPNSLTRMAFHMKHTQSNSYGISLLLYTHKTVVRCELRLLLVVVVLLCFAFVVTVCGISVFKATVWLSLDSPESSCSDLTPARALLHLWQQPSATCTSPRSQDPHQVCVCVFVTDGTNRRKLRVTCLTTKVEGLASSTCTRVGLCCPSGMLAFSLAFCLAISASLAACSSAFSAFFSAFSSSLSSLSKSSSWIEF